MTLNQVGVRGGNGIGKGQTWDTQSAVALFIGALTTGVLAPM